MGEIEDRDWTEEDRRMAYGIGWRMGLDRAIAEIRRVRLHGAPARGGLDRLVTALEALAAEGPGAGAEALALSERCGDRLTLGYPATADEGPSGPCQFLRGRPIGPGDEVELSLSGGRWVRGVFGWTGRPGDPPSLTLELRTSQPPERVEPAWLAGAMTVDIPRVSFPLPEGAILRW